MEGVGVSSDFPDGRGSGSHHCPALSNSSATGYPQFWWISLQCSVGFSHARAVFTRFGQSHHKKKRIVELLPLSLVGASGRKWTIVGTESKKWVNSERIICATTLR